MHVGMPVDAIARSAGFGGRMPRQGTGTLFFFIAAFLSLASVAQALTCDDEITRNAGICVQQTGLNNAAKCRQQAMQACQCNAANQCGGGGFCDAAMQAKAKINIDWVFADGGARATFGTHRQMGESAFEAVVSAQAHNPPVQALLRECRAWAEGYINQAGGCTLGNHAPGPAQCQCISVQPTGEFDQTGTPIYLVTNACPDGMKVKVEFVDAAPRTGGPASWGQPILTCPARAYRLRAPQTFAIPSINAYGLQNAGGAYTCVCRGGVCN